MGEKRHTVTIQQNRGSPIVVSKSDIAVQGQSDARPQESIQIISGKCNLKQIKQIEESFVEMGNLSNEPGTPKS